MNDETNQYSPSLLDLLCNNPEQISTAANIVSLLIAKDRSSDDLNVIGNFIVGVGGLILTIAAQKQFCESKQDKLKQIADLKQQIKKLEESL